MKRILIIEDEKNITRFLELELKYEGYEVDSAENGRFGLEKAISEEWDCILLDLMLPELNGVEVCRRIRAVKSTPIIMITARDSVMDRVSGLDSGADDYIAKPFAIEELLARIRSLLRRVGTKDEVKDEVLNNRQLTLKIKARQVIKNGELIDLTKREYDLLLMFMSNQNIVLSREAILNKVWGYETEVETNVVDVYIRYLRNKIDIGETESYIQTIRGTGYVMRG
ncbi:DNA-binding response OmpR family regulator [Bacillus mesophilus]|uniref:Response regulator transcription factor n=1 Tax=Bacillus mesophilus TaxID=1808955 RepID=A0A6M0QB77_9BACI|nr:response regulator transcription factor [Bacillus mesophilus]MBM7663067.1 DNA-binding response OmpR family regulator [Bacillus mesophilus]NEY73614.1 response regulator transcription factor [Bacillus mesophilus]